MKYLKHVWQVLIGLVYIGLVIAILSVASTRFETLVLAGLVQLYSAVLYNFSVIGTTSDANNLAGFVRFKILATAQGVTANEDGTFEEQQKALADSINRYKTTIIIRNLANAVVSIYAMFKIVQTVLQ